MRSRAAFVSVPISGTSRRRTGPEDFSKQESSGRSRAPIRAATDKALAANGDRSSLRMTRISRISTTPKLAATALFGSGQSEDRDGAGHGPDKTAKADHDGAKDRAMRFGPFSRELHDGQIEHEA